MKQGLFNDILNSKQDMLVDLVYALKHNDKADLHKCLLQQDKFCHVISPNELYAQWLDGAWCYVLVMDATKTCHAIIGRAELEDVDDNSDDMPMPKTTVLATLGPKTIRGIVNHAIRFNRKLVLIQLSNMPTVCEHESHSYNVAWRYEQAKRIRIENVMRIKLIKALVDTFAIADVHTYAEFRNALPVCANALAHNLKTKFGIDIMIQTVQITEYANVRPALFVEFRLPCTVNGYLNKWASCIPSTVGCRTISDDERPAFMLKRSIIAMLNVFAYNVDRTLQCCMTNIASNLIYKGDDLVRKFIPEQYTNVLCR